MPILGPTQAAQEIQLRHHDLSLKGDEMSYCYTEMDSPDFFGISGESGVVKHDLDMEQGDLKGSEQQSLNSIISAILIQLNTDRVQNGERGWWGDEFQGFNIGNHAYRLSESAYEKRAIRADAMIREALETLVKQGIIDEIIIETTQVVGGVEASVDIIKNGKTIFRTIV